MATPDPQPYSRWPALGFAAEPHSGSHSPRQRWPHFEPVSWREASERRALESEEGLPGAGGLAGWAWPQALQVKAAGNQIADEEPPALSNPNHAALSRASTGRTRAAYQPGSHTSLPPCRASQEWRESGMSGMSSRSSQSTGRTLPGIERTGQGIRGQSRKMKRHRF